MLLELFDLAELTVVPPSDAPKQLRAMHARHGVSEGHTCGECAHFCRGRYHDKTYFKCALYTPWTHGPGTDWRKKYAACGKFEGEGCDGG